MTEPQIHPEQPYLTNKQYNVLKRITQIVLPAAGSLYFGLAAIWSLPAAEQVVGSIALLTTFFGVTLEVSSRRYDIISADPEGQLVVKEGEDGKKLFSLELNRPPEEIEQMDTIRFKVQKKIAD